nr:basic proline-rich protein-like [Microcebus murinus]
MGTPVPKEVLHLGGTGHRRSVTELGPVLPRLPGVWLLAARLRPPPSPRSHPPNVCPGASYFSRPPAPAPRGKGQCPTASLPLGWPGPCEVVTTPASRGGRWYQPGPRPRSSPPPRDGGAHARAGLRGRGQRADPGLLRLPLPLPRGHDHPLRQGHHGPLQRHPHVHLGGAAPGRLSWAAGPARDPPQPPAHSLWPPGVDVAGGGRPGPHSHPRGAGVSGAAGLGGAGGRGSRQGRLCRGRVVAFLGFWAPSGTGSSTDAPPPRHTTHIWGGGGGYR